MPPVSHGNTLPSTAPNLVRHPWKLPLSVKPDVAGVIFTPPRHATNAARCGLFSLRRSQGGFASPSSFIRQAVVNQLQGASKALSRCTEIADFGSEGHFTAFKSRTTLASLRLNRGQTEIQRNGALGVGPSRSMEKCHAPLNPEIWTGESFVAFKSRNSRRSLLLNPGLPDSRNGKRANIFVCNEKGQKHSVCEV